MDFKPSTLSVASGTNDIAFSFHSLGGFSSAKIPMTPSSEDIHEAGYFNHFHRHVRHLLPAASLQFTEGSLQPLCLRFAMLCISASNLSMLDTRVQSCISATDRRRSIFSPLVNALHHRHAQNYQDLSLWHFRNAHLDDVKRQAPAFLAALVLIALYHHASTNHLRFRLAVMDSVRFVLIYRTQLMDSAGGADSLQMWFRLCTSHRPAKPPALLLEGQGASSLGPNLLPDITERLYLDCILGMSADDLIYDILIKTLEIRTKLVVYRCVANSLQISEMSSEVGSLAYEILNKMLGRRCVPEEYAEAREGFVQSSHLLGLLEVQKERLEVWRSQLNENQLPKDSLADVGIQNETSWRTSFSPICQSFPNHRDTINALHCLLCETIFEEANGVDTFCWSFLVVNECSTRLENLARNMCQIAGIVDFKISNTSDVYTLSLAETMLQIVLLWRSDEIFSYVLDVLWPQLEMNGRGYEHSHYPTHLVKRIITQIAAYWEQGRAIFIALPAVPEEIPKSKLLDINHPVDMVVCGYNKHGKNFIEKVSLP
ncbi:hypothetical protein N7491_000432 [Penicillium cf. griseofulvum]|uniref:Zn(II)2Cys6 transcription factor n=1 Tax=Penicillium cf. griseofulvum TaxID=2972120 RepID=A0A9W9JL99_9EURO|nr:hypothetical protein N7472_004208 [Penicillium cf. griseofulvum]KAJ5451250.1 hypothetical protein N7491_000432 [Penicillium cf. griseofulvum]